MARYPCNLCPWKHQNDEILKENKGFETGIVKFLKKMKVLGSVAGRKREFPQAGETARPGSNIVENVRFGAPGPFPGTLNLKP